MPLEFAKQIKPLNTLLELVSTFLPQTFCGKISFMSTSPMTTEALR